MRKILLFIALFPIFVIGQTQSENYIKNTIYKEPTSVIIPNPTISQATQTVTYFDGLGREIQKVASKQSASGKNIIMHYEYDSYGRQVKQYLPYSTNTDGLNYESNAASAVLNYPQYVGQNPYNEKEVEASPLDRVFKQASPGNSWAMGNGHEVRYDYLTNTSSDLIKLYRATATWDNTKGLYEISLSQNGSTNYPVNSLYKQVAKNENWVSGNDNTVQIFKDNEGKMILRRTFDNNVPHDTYYVHDQFGNLTYVIPPLVTSISTQMDGLCYQYKYDRLNRQVEKKLPGKQWEFIIYDKLDRVIATGPAISPFYDIGGNGWLINKYDSFDRIIYTGWYSADVTATSRASLQAVQNVSTTILNETKQSSGSIDGVNVYYSNVVAPVSFKLLSINYFDDYAFPDAPASIPANVLNDNSQPVFYNTTTKPKGLPTAIWERILGSSTSNIYEKSYMLYDRKSRVVRVFSKNSLGGYLQADAKLNFVGQTLYTEIKHKRQLTDANEIYVKDSYIYSDQGRVLTQIHQIGLTGTPQLLSKNTYDELGNVITQNIGGTDLSGATALQKVNYSYNIKGWLTGINDVSELSIGTDPRDLFAFKINYDAVEGNVANVNPLYNGNISETYWRTSSDNRLRKYGYEYDKLNRLLNATYQKPETTTPIPNSYRESLSYDKNGNITHLIRNGGLDSETNYLDALKIDELSYSYDSNQLLAVTDDTNHPDGFKDGADNMNEYGYDENGNMIRDDNKGITRITYNHLNLPTQIIFNNDVNTKIEYVYNSSGEKIQKKVTQYNCPTCVAGTNTTNVEYISGFQYKNGVLLFFPHSNGYVNNTVVNGNNVYNYVFNYKDHLGNIRVSYGLNSSNELKIIEENHYYPYGLKHSSYNTEQLNYAKMENQTVNLKAAAPSAPLLYQYKFGEKEFQNELSLNLYDFGARNYDPALGRWMNIDPLAEVSRRFSPYTYANDNPVFFIDPDGMMAIGSNGTGDPSKEQIDGVDENEVTDPPTGIIRPNGTVYTDGDKTWVYDAETNTWVGQNGAENVSNEIPLAEVIVPKKQKEKEWKYYSSGAYGWNDGKAEAFWNEYAPITSSCYSISQGVKNGDGGQVACGIGFLFIDIVTFGEGSIYFRGAKAGVGGIQYTKSSLALGREMHAGYMVAEHAPKLRKFKEFTGIKGIRPDFVDFTTKTIYELKPYNPRGIQLGTKQLNNYKSLFEQTYGGTWKTVLDFY